MSEQTIYLAFGPVQEFISQARRTRDLWAGSYLLSYLAGSALARVADSCEMVLPAIEGNPLMDALRRGGVPQESGSRVGSIPHVAELRAPAERAGQVAQAAVAGWQEAWKRVSKAVRAEWQRRRLPWTATTGEVWERQVAGVWTHAWVLGDPAGMARRKTLRAFTLEDEPGEKCTCCGAREALHAGDGSRKEVRDFWTEVAHHGGLHDVQPKGKERLCTLCTVKRFFPYIAADALGWSVPTGFPSTTTMASIPWRLSVLKAGATDPRLRDAVSLHMWALEEARVPLSIPRSFFPALRDAADAWSPSDREVADAFIQIDGDWFSPEVVGDREREAELGDQRTAVLGTLRELLDAVRAVRLPMPSTSYALLAMDGDSMGKLLRTHADRKEHISQALAAFSRRVPEIVEGREANGVLIYAGGDDVLALLPKDTALRVAADLRGTYHDEFTKHLPEMKATISAGLVYAHMNAPLREVVATAHRILEEQAKDTAGRDALAVAVWKRPGIVLEFARKWDSGREGDIPLVDDIETVRDGLGKKLEKNQYGRGFLYHLRDLLPAASPEWTEETVDKLLAAEYLKSRERTATREEAEARVVVLRRLAGVGWRDTAPVLLAAFLAGEED
ncbi:MAG: type III-B CRISPR-associated protein Cas10/Cmr2 [Chloroflexi bacterium]|nr:type III-B CRISPR-associated protein Cas10/Cmr2 [Chloroflexota bacterium]